MSEPMSDADLNHGITHGDEGWNKTATTGFINRHVFPDGELRCVRNIELGTERAGLSDGAR